VTSAGEPPLDRPRPHLPALDGLRGLAILLVLFVHFVGDEVPRTSAQYAAVKVANYGVWGVDLFFVLSGFLITGILYDAKSTAHYFRDFYVRRSLRIFPLYYGVLALLFLVYPATTLPYPAALALSGEHQTWLWTYGTNLYLSLTGGWSLPFVSHFWSLAVEEHFYLVWPLVVLLATRRALLRICVGASLFALSLRVFLAHGGATDVVLTAFTPCRLDALCLGGFLAIALRTVGIERLAGWAVPGVATGAMLVLATSIWNALGGPGSWVVLPLRGTLVAITFGAALVLAIAAGPSSWLRTALTSPLLRRLGTYSYGLYVFHGVIAYALQRPLISAAIDDALGSHALAMTARAVVGAALSLGASALSYELYEKQFLRLKERFAPSTRAQAESVPPASEALRMGGAT
jgi:peptidoglycan/LPS O-acetylase OafA/YrhL